MKSEYPKLTPDKLYDYINKFQGSKSKSDIEEVKAWWTKMVIKWFKDYAGVPKSIDRKKLSVQKRILYITKQKNYDNGKQHGIMGIVAFTTHADENLPDVTQGQIMFTDEERLSFTYSANGNELS